ncbi:MAG: hypothetical protein M0R03_03950 [Novosphingobium sp.]|nr:hypothetical protein [Novosphingobium sp.]
MNKIFEEKIRKLGYNPDEIFMVASNPFFKFFTFESAYNYFKKYPSIYIFNIFCLKYERYENIGYFNMNTGEFNEIESLDFVLKEQKKLRHKKRKDIQ